eukprot:Sdes_comp14937_c0_seq1m3640
MSNHEDFLKPLLAINSSLERGSTPSRCAAQPSKGLCVGNKIAYALGSWPSSFTHTILGFYLSNYMLEIQGIPALNLAVLLFISRFWDAFMDPFVGLLSDRTQSRWGRRKPWMFLAILPCSFFYISIWAPVAFHSSLHQFLYYLLVYCAFMTSFSAYYVPYNALVMDIAGSAPERDSALTFRMTADILGVALAALCQGMIVNAAGSLSCLYLFAACCVAFIIVFSSLTTLMWACPSEEHTALVSPAVCSPSTPREGSLSDLSSVASLFSFRPFLWLTLMYVCCWINIQMVQNSMILYLKYVCNLERDFQSILLCLLAVTFLSTPILRFLIHRFGKCFTFVAGMSSLALVEALLFCGITDRFSMFALASLSGIGVSTAYLLPFMMLPDVIQEDSLRMGGIRREGLCFSFFVFSQKCAAGIALSLSNLLLSLGGYDADLLVYQPDSVATTLCYLLGGIPCALAVCSLVFLGWYHQSLQPRRMYPVCIHIL